MKLSEIKKAPLSFEMPSADEIAEAKRRFQSAIAGHRLYHATTERSAKRILKVGFKAMSYFTPGEPGWDEDVNLVVPGREVAGSIYPDPEHLIDSDKTMELFKRGSTPWGYKTFVKQADKDLLFWLFYDLHKQEGWGGDVDGFWVICLDPIPPEHIEEE